MSSYIGADVLEQEELIARAASEGFGVNIHANVARNRSYPILISPCCFTSRLSFQECSNTTAILRHDFDCLIKKERKEEKTYWHVYTVKNVIFMEEHWTKIFELCQMHYNN